MLNLLYNFFANDSFIPHGHCYLWQPGLVWLNIISDSLIAFSYYSIPIILIYFAQKRKDFPFTWILLLFGIFIISCGTTHIMDVWTLWHPTYWLSSCVKAITAFFSVYTALMLIPIIPKALALPSPKQLETANSKLVITLEELKNTQTQLIQSEKMSSLGTLIAGIAHEINNPINFIFGNIHPANEYVQDLLNLISLYKKHYPEPVTEIQDYSEKIDIEFIKEDLPKILDSMKIGSERIHRIVLSLRNFLGLNEANIKKVNVGEGIDSTLLILGNRLKAKQDRPAIEVAKEYDNLPKIECYPGQLNQVFMNLLNYAIDALDESMVSCHWIIPDKTPGVTLEMLNNYLPNLKPKIQIRAEYLNIEQQVRISISDNSCGMTQEVQEKIFDPLSITISLKSITNCGILISQQIIHKHHGNLKCISAPLQGTEFIIEIPISLNPYT